MEKQHNRGQEGAGLAYLDLEAEVGTEYMFRERAEGSDAITEIFKRVEVPSHAQLYLGHLRYSTTGKSGLTYVHPYLRRNNWHIHHKQVQVLICVAGRGWYQEWGKEPQVMTPGTVIAIPAEVKHWHGAAKDSWFQHLTYHKDVQEGASNEWLEPVDDMARM